MFDIKAVEAEAQKELAKEQGGEARFHLVGWGIGKVGVHLEPLVMRCAYGH